MINAISKPKSLTYWDVSTAHITRQDSRILAEYSQGNEAGLIVHRYEEGFFIPVLEERLTDARLSQDFIRLYRMAQENGISMLRLDRDAEIVEGLPVHEW